jgi:hypothetical protein
MSVPESYYLRVEGQMRGPYTLPQVRHMVAARIISGEVQYWFEGMEEPRPVEELFAVPVRSRRRLILWTAAIVLVLVAGVVAAMIFLEPEEGAWREGNGLLEKIQRFIYVLFFRKQAG